MSKKEQLISAFIKGKVSRRDFSAGLATMGLSVPMVATVINESIATAEAAEPVAGGRLTAAYSSGSAADTIDPTKAVQDIDIARIQLLGSRLVDFRPGHGDEPLLPNLATEWESNDDATVWRFKLLKDAEFHNGKTITPADVAYTVNRHKTEGSPQAPLLANIESVTTDGDYAVFNLSGGDADIAYLMSGYGMQIMPEDQGAEAYAEGTAVGAGPFVVEEFEPGITAVFKRNPNYHKDGKPLLDEVETFSIRDNSSRVNALAAGDVDAVASVEANLVGQVERSDRIRILTQPGSAFGAYNMRCDTPPYDDVNVRTALKWAFDREKIVELGFNGHGVVARDNPIPSHDPFFCDEVPVPYADPDKVKYHLRQAGAENYPFELITCDATFGGANIGILMGEMMRENGVTNMQVTRAPSDGYFSAIWMVKPFFIGYWYGRPTANLAMSIAFTSTAEWNESYWKRPQFDQILADARKETNFAKRKQLYCDAQMMISSDSGVIIPNFVNWTDGLSNRVQGMTGNPLMFLGSMYWDDVWLDDSQA